jgi:hypothetical protein
MTAATFLSFPHLADIRGWPQGRQPPRRARQHGSAISRASGPTGVGRKSLAHPRLANQTTANPGCAEPQAADFQPFAITQSP